MAKAAKKAFKWVSKVALGLAGFAIKPVLRALTPKAPEIDVSRAVNFRADPNAGVPYVIGRTGTAGTYIYATVGEPKNRNILFYTILSGGGPIDSFESFSMGGTPVVFDGADTPESGPYRHLVWQRRQLGTTPQAYLEPPNTTDAAVLSEWNSTHATSGYAAAWYVCGADQNAYSGGVPDPLWVLKGVRCYDWRLDSTYPGGSGPQRVNDPDTWAFNECPAVHAVTWILGRYQNGRRVLGLGGTLAQTAMDKFTEWANVCDANGWKVGGVVYSTDTKWQVLKAICQAGGAYPIPLGAKISVIFNAPRVSIATLTGADMDGEPSIVGTQLRRDRYNAAVPRFRSEANGWQIVPAAPLVVSSFVTQDGEQQRTKELEWPLVQDVDQATQLAAYGICNSREIGPLDFPVVPYWMGLEPGDCITVNEPEYGLTSQKLIIVARNRALSTCERSISCVTETDSKHPFCLGQSGTPPPLPSLNAVDTLPSPPDATDWEVTEGEVAGPGGTLPAIILTGAATDPNAIAIIVEYREVISPGVYGAWVGNEYPIYATRIEITGLKPGAKYQVRVRYRYARNTEDPIGGNLDLGEIDVSDLTAPVPPDVLADIAAAQSAADAAQADADAALTALFDPTTGALVEIDTLQTGQATHSSQIGVLQTTDLTLAGRIDTTEAKQQVRPNRLKNSNNADPTPLNYWTVAGPAIWGKNEEAQVGTYFYSSGGADSYFVQEIPAGPGMQFTLSVEGDPGANGPSNWPVLFANWSDGTTDTAGGQVSLTSANMDWFGKRASFTTTIAPAGTTKLRVIFRSLPGSAGWAFSKVMVSFGTIAMPWNDVKTEADTVSRVQGTEIASASNTAAIAATETRVGVAMQQGSYINANARMGSYTASPGLPDGWPVIWGGVLASRFSRQNGEGANYAVRAAPAAGEELGFYQTVTLTAGKHLLTFEGKCNSGDWQGAALTLSGTYTISCATDTDLAGATGVGGTGVRRWSKIIDVAAGSYTLHAMYGWSGAGTVTAKSLDLYVAGVQPLDAGGKLAMSASADASSALIAAATVDSALAAYESTANARLDGLDATTTTQGTAISNLQGRTASWLTKVAAAGADPAYIYMQSDATAAGGTDSYIALVAKSLFLYNTVGGSLVLAMSVSGGNAYFPGSVLVGPTENVILDGPNKRILVKDGSGNIVCEMGQLL